MFTLNSFLFLQTMQSSKKKKSFQVPVTSLIGSSYANLLDIAAMRKIDKGYKVKYALTNAVARILDLFQLFERGQYKSTIESVKIDQPPIFIIGFWRSGTTVLHNLLCQNPDFGFVNTYQAVFPNHSLSNQWWLKKIANLVLPENRPGDNMKLNFEFPQEEEIALGNLQPISFYNFFYFPNDFEEFVARSLYFKDVTDTEFEKWKLAYTNLIKVAIANTKGKQFISKNPPNTFRIKQILEIFPDAKFIYIHRNTYETIYSFQGFVHGVHEGIKYQNYDESAHDHLLIDLYKQMADVYEKDKLLIPEGQLVEVKFEHFENNMKEEVSRIYKKLGIQGIDKAKPYMDSYLKEIGDYKRRTHELDKNFKKQVDDRLGDLVEL